MPSTLEVSTRTRRLRHALLVYMSQELGRRICEARDKLGMSQAELAYAVGLKHPQSISKYERGESEVPRKRLLRIAEVTGKPLSYFLEDEPEPKEDPAGGMAEVIRLLEAQEARHLGAMSELTELTRTLVEQVAALERVHGSPNREQPPPAAQPGQQ